MIIFLIKKILPGILISIGFFLLDEIWIKALPVLDLSFSRSSSTLVMFFLIRSGLFLVWFLLLISLLIRPNIIIPTLFPWLLFIVNLLVLLFGLYGFCYEPFHLTVSQFNMPVPGLKRPIRIVQLSDLHVEFTTQRERDVPPLVKSLNPDMIVLTGDYMNESYSGNEDAINDMRDVIRQLHAPLGIYAVNGNVETPWEMQEWFKGMNINILDDQIAIISDIADQFTIVGLSFYDWRDNDQALVKLMDEVNPQAFSLLLYHKPDIAYTARDEHVNLYLAGHTHGGQVRLPFYGAVVTNSKYGKQFEMGLYHLDKTTLFVSRGLGFTGGVAPRIRFLAPPEVVVIDLVPQTAN
jgi:uncharacterized protein